MGKNKRSYNTIIIGAGPAGLFAAHRLVNSNYKGSIAIIDKGKPVDSRKCDVAPSSNDTVLGVGGAGFFSDGKLCISYKVGNKLHDLDGEHRLFNCFSYFNETLTNLLVESRINYVRKIYNNDEITLFKKRCKNLGLKYNFYPVIHLGSDHYYKFTNKVVNSLQAKCDFYTLSTAVEFKKKNGKFDILIDNCQKHYLFQSDNLILAPGKNGANWLYEIAEGIGLRTEYNPVYMGLRIETRKKVPNSLTNLSDDPKIHMILNDVHTKIHCFCEGGQVIAVDYNGYQTVGGHSFSRRHSPNTNFSILYKVNSKNVESRVLDFLSSVNNQGKGKPLLQRLGDFRKLKTTMEKDLKNNPVRPTLDNYSTGDLSKLLPKEVRETFLIFIEKLNNFYPDVNHPSTLLYAPVIEWCTRRFKVNENMQTDIDNLFVCGDGSGWTQGIVAAAISGILASELILERQ